MSIYRITGELRKPHCRTGPQGTTATGSAGHTHLQASVLCPALFPLLTLHKYRCLVDTADEWALKGFRSLAARESGKWNFQLSGLFSSEGWAARGMVGCWKASSHPDMCLGIESLMLPPGPGLPLQAMMLTGDNYMFSYFLIYKLQRTLEALSGWYLSFSALVQNKTKLKLWCNNSAAGVRLHIGAWLSGLGLF